MFEVEKKFILSPQQEKTLLQGADFLSERIFTDIYYDTPKYTLTSQDIWLRSREGNFELKLPLNKNGVERIVDQYQEIEGEDKIREIFALPRAKSFVQDIAEFDYQPFCKVTTTRRKYKQGKFVIDLDTAQFENFRLEICEIELMVADKNEIEKAAAEILEFASQFKLQNAPVRGKVIEYLKRNRPQHYQVLVENGVVRG